MAQVDGRTGWGEAESRLFLDHGNYFVPERETQIDTVCSVVPPPADGAPIVEICCGEGLLCSELARRFPRAEIHALDGSPAMLAAAREKLGATGSVWRASLIDIADDSWRRFEKPVHAFVSSLAVHHLDGPAKARLFADLTGQLAPGGVLVIADLVEARRDCCRELWERQWNDGVRERARLLDGDEAMFGVFREEGWNYYSDPDAAPVDMPSGLFEQMTWMAQAGLDEIDVHWLRAGHAIFSGRKP